ncbi:MAG: trigger factor [Candidatus Omnitrophica bacterium]|nr:trigger factor [Candidatus Omnitrophota bacterium]
MKVLNIEEVAPTKRKMTLQIEPGDLESEREEAYEELGKEAALPGFRKGKVPRKLLELRFDKTIRREAFADAVGKAVKDAAKERDLHIIGRPDFDESEIEAKVDQVAENAVEVNVSLDVVPPFEVPPYKDQKFNLPPLEFTEEDIEASLRRAQEEEAYYVAVDDRPTREGDFLLIEVKTTRGDKEIEALTHQRLMVGDLCGGERLEVFDKGLLGRVKGEQFEFDYDLPSDHPLFEEGETNTLHVTGRIQQINDRVLPNLDDEFAKDLGYETLDQYRAFTRNQLEYQRSAVLAGAKRRLVEGHLLSKTEVTVPAALVQTHYLWLKYSREIEARESGESEASLPTQEKRRRELETMYEAEQDAKRTLVFAKIAELEGLSLSDDEYIDSMARIARSQGEKDIDKFLADAERKGLENLYKESFLMSKVSRFLVENNEFVKGSGAEADDGAKESSSDANEEKD